MRLTKELWTMVFILGGMLSPMQSPAYTGLTVQVNGSTYSPLTCSTLPAPYNTAPILSECDGSARTYGNVTIEKHNDAAGVAWLDISDLNNADRIYLKNAVIKSTINKPTNCNSTGSNYTNCQNILLSALFSGGPTPTTTVSVDFFRSVNWELMRPSTSSGALGSYFRVDGWVEGNQVIAAQQKSITCSNPSTQCWAFNWTQGPLTFSYPSLPSDRELKTKIWFGMATKSSDVLRIISLGVYNPSGSGGESSTGDSATDPTIVRESDEGCTLCCQTCPEENGKGRGHTHHKDNQKHDTKKKVPN
ncbi:MAG: hypothetical protein HOP22_04650 [Nitrospiraceae bacterium]|nr:hypothetical protein [Nitrospiraceae bacterium]